MASDDYDTMKPDSLDSTVLAGKKSNMVDMECNSTVHLTPDKILDPLRSYWGGVIPFDAATLPSNPTKALRFLTEEEDGLVTPWEKSTFINPPYGQSIAMWTEKILLEAAMNTEVIALMPMGSRWSTNYWQSDVVSADLKAICFVKGRVSFLDPQGVPHKHNPHDSAIYGYNVDTRKFCAHLGHLGKIILVGGIYYRPNKHPMKAHLAKRYNAMQQHNEED